MFVKLIMHNACFILCEGFPGSNNRLGLVRQWVELEPAILISKYFGAQCATSCGGRWSVSLLLFTLYLVKMYATIENFATCEVVTLYPLLVQ